jgi:hypothetical protein
MSYTINLTNGSVLTTIADGTLNTTACSMALPGKNYAGYGIYLDDNFVHLLENSSNSTAPSTPLIGQLWWDSANKIMNVWNGTVWKTISSATSSSTQPTSNVQGDLWYDTVNQQLNVYSGTSWILVGPAFTQGQGTTGAIPATVKDNSNVDHTILQFYVNGILLGVMSRDTTAFTPSPAIAGFDTIKPGLQLSSSNAAYVFQGLITNSLQLNGLASTSFMRADAAATTTGKLTTTSNQGLAVGASGDFTITVAGTSVNLTNNDTNGNINFGANIAGNITTVMSINGSTGIVSSATGINANYADLAERFEADAELSPGTVVELGGSAEITQVNADLSENVFGVISTRAAYMMNGAAGTNATHPPVAMTGRVPVRTIGQVRKGDRMVSAGNGLARAAQAGEATAFNVIGRALRDKLDDSEGTVEAIVTIK